MRKSVVGGYWIDLGGEDWDAVRAEAPSGARPPMGRSYVMESLAKTLVSICDTGFDSEINHPRCGDTSLPLEIGEREVKLSRVENKSASLETSVSLRL